MPLASMSKVTSIWGAPGRRRDADQLEVAQQLVAVGHLALALEDLDVDLGLAVVGGGEHLERRVGMVVLRSMSLVITAAGLDAERQRGRCSRMSLTSPLSTPARRNGADDHDLVGVDPLVGLLAAGELLDELDHHGHPGRAADQHRMVDIDQALLGLGLPVGDRLVEGVRSRSTRSEVIRSSSPRVRRCSMCSGPRGVAVMKGRLIVVSRVELDLGLLGRLLEPLHGHLVVGQVDAVVVLEGGQQPLDDPLVPVVAAQVHVPGGRLDLDDPLADVEQGDVEGAAAQVEHEDGLVSLSRVGEGRGRLVDDARRTRGRRPQASLVAWRWASSK